MTKSRGDALLMLFKENCDRDNDPYFVCHFSREDNYYNGDHNGMDKWDAMILISELIRDFNLTPTHINSVFSNIKTLNHDKT